MNEASHQRIDNTQQTLERFEAAGMVQQADKPTGFEQRQIDALNETNALLKERGAR